MANCKAYLQSKDLRKHKAQTQLINDVTEQIREAAAGLELPDDLNKVCCDFYVKNQPEVLIILGSPSPCGSETSLKELWATTHRKARTLEGTYPEKTNLESDGTNDLLLLKFMTNASRKFVRYMSGNIPGMVWPVFELTPVPSPS